VLPGTRPYQSAKASSSVASIRFLRVDAEIEPRGASPRRDVKCGETNETEANFCSSCGTAIQKTLACVGCGEMNDPDARFCDNCGRPTSNAQSEN